MPANRAVSESTARRAARRAGLVARKSRKEFSSYNYGNFMLIDPAMNACIAGSRFDMTPAQVVEYCRNKQ